MDREVVRDMARDRMLGNFTYQDYDERDDELRRMGAANMQQPPLPPSPCVRFKATGEVHEWSEFFASRPDLCENCDETGNTDPAAWRGQGSSAVEVASGVSEISQSSDGKSAVGVSNIIGPALPAPANLCFYPEQFEIGGMTRKTPPVYMASAVLGVSEEFSRAYTEPVATKEALPLTGMGGNVSVNAAIERNFEQLFPH